MPVEVKELVIRASIDDKPTADTQVPDVEALRQDLMDRCAEMIKTALKNQSRR